MYKCSVCVLGGNDHSFELHVPMTEGKRYLMYAESETSLDEWVSAIVDGSIMNIMDLNSMTMPSELKEDESKMEACHKRLVTLLDTICSDQQVGDQEMEKCIMDLKEPSPIGIQTLSIVMNTKRSKVSVERW